MTTEAQRCCVTELRSQRMVAGLGVGIQVPWLPELHNRTASFVFHLFSPEQSYPLALSAANKYASSSPSLPWTLRHLKTCLQFPICLYVSCKHTCAFPCAQPLAENFPMTSECTKQQQQQWDGERTTSGLSDHTTKKPCTTARTMRQKGDQVEPLAPAHSSSYWLLKQGGGGVE